MVLQNPKHHEGLRHALPQEDGVILHQRFGFCQPTHARMARIEHFLLSHRSVSATSDDTFQPPGAAVLRGRPLSTCTPVQRGRMIFFGLPVTSGRSTLPSLYVISSYVAPAQSAQIDLSGLDDAVGGMAPLHTPTMSATSLRGHQ
ncbi:hypothetical protein QT196_38915 (plasmid) [Streptomyces sp. P9-2B-2]|uniref:hypothetical protein n=1 Tax=Streptomyces sp. P9-2B-2 TaxID=3057114 RepID=UPI0025B4C56C|nr:hypothetical protein [Streptomyces sp. P9-2B-2]WJY43236.1 hypothetical protein QT196_38915 [Streptomyces sp. P9-2B-2]